MPSLSKKLKATNRRLFVGEISLRGRRLPKLVITGLLGVVFLYVSVAGMTSVTTAWFVTKGDTIPHVDYVWRLYNGDIPRYSDGIRYPAFVERGGGKKYQQASPNPPLFYMIQAPLIGPLLNSGHWRPAIAVGRALNMVMGIGCILALAWGGWLFGGRKKALMAVAVPALGVLTYRFTRLNVDFALDALLVLFSTLSLINAYKLLQYGLKTRYLVWLTVLSVAGMATKATYLVFLGISMLALVLASLLHEKGSTLRRWLKGIGLAAGLGVMVTAATGWFYYYWNYKANGNWFSSLPASYHGSRTVYHSLSNIIASKGYWELFFARYTVIGTISVVISVLALAGYFSLRKTDFRKLRQDRALFWGLVLMVLATAGVALSQLKLAVGYGSLNFRYFLPALLPFGLFLAYGLLAYRRLRGQLVSVVAIIMAGVSLLSLRAPATLGSVFGHPGQAIHGLFAGTQKNHVPSIITALLLTFFVMGAVLLIQALFKLSQNSKKS